MHGLFEELGRHAKRGGSQDVLIVGLARNLLNTFFLSVRHMIPRDKMLSFI